MKSEEQKRKMAVTKKTAGINKALCYNGQVLGCLSFEFWPQLCILVLGPALEHTAHPACRPTGNGNPFPEIKRPRLGADHYPSSDAEVKNEWSCAATPTHVLWSAEERICRLYG